MEEELAAERTESCSLSSCFLIPKEENINILPAGCERQSGVQGDLSKGEHVDGVSLKSLSSIVNWDWGSQDISHLHTSVSLDYVGKRLEWWKNVIN